MPLMSLLWLKKTRRVIVLDTQLPLAGIMKRSGKHDGGVRWTLQTQAEVERLIQKKTRFIENASKKALSIDQWKQKGRAQADARWMKTYQVGHGSQALYTGWIDFSERSFPHCIHRKMYSYILYNCILWFSCALPKKTSCGVVRVEAPVNPHWCVIFTHLQPHKPNESSELMINRLEHLNKSCSSETRKWRESYNCSQCMNFYFISIRKHLQQAIQITHIIVF